MTHYTFDNMYQPDVESNCIKVKRLSTEAVVPTRSNKQDAGYDLYALEDTPIYGTTTSLVRTGIAVEPPKGYHFEIIPRSSTPLKKGLWQPNSIGLIDEGYRGELLVPMRTLEGREALVNKGDRIAQLVLRKTELREIVEVDNLSETDRGAGSFGSSGN